MLPHLQAVTNNMEALSSQSFWMEANLGMGSVLCQTAKPHKHWLIPTVVAAAFRWHEVHYHSISARPASSLATRPTNVAPGP